ncbi:aryl hydrocarbon receptor interacting protein related [Holotrichia oblita]|uniref:Aryl hydrocarbon receptor interacting protein related n=1 Tax=Holotrichia oblita TaxID=644536 RepID=A0ACB9T2D7_HOLOL|nr:aryl hydrocarbon receptor interacting protein related [Holotrichia oblita]
MAPNSNDPLIEKKILHPGRQFIEIRSGAKCFFQFQTKTRSDGRIVDDSRKMGKGKPLELVIGKKFKLEVWEAVLQKMAVGEVAEFTVHKDLVLQYPFVAKTLRDVDLPPEKRKAHHCSMNIQAGGIGYDDLNQLIKYPEDLIFIMELVHIEQPENYEKEVWQMDDEERMKRIPELKEKGNEEYKKKNYGLASDLYAQAIGILEQFMLKEKPNDTEWLEFNNQKNVILLNFAQCKLILEDYYAVIQHCSTVLKHDPNNVKALFRRAKGFVGAWDPQAARDDFNKVIELDSSLSSAVKRELEILDEMIRNKNVQDMQKLKNLFI